jgi:hypothetical protein
MTFGVGVPGLRKLVTAASILLALSVSSISCYNSNGSNYQNPSRVKFRAFISNPLHPISTGNVPVLEIIDAKTDLVSFSPVGLTSFPDIGAMDLSRDKKLTLVYSPANNTFGLVVNATESGVLTTTALPDFTQSFFIAVDDKHAYAAVPNAPVTGNPPGAVLQIDLATGAISATIPVPHVRYIVQSNLGDHILAFADNSDSVTVITTLNIGTSTDPRVEIPGFDHPASGVFNVNGTQAFILNCGPECGGTAASVTPLTLATNTLGTPIPVPAATAGFLANSTLFVAGTPGASSCDPQTELCGRLTSIDINNLTVTNTGEVPITDGYHNRFELSDNGTLFVGARDCTNINIPANGSTPAVVRGCLSIVKTSDLSVVTPPDNGDVTGIANVPSRNVVYVVEGGELRIYDTTTQKLLVDHQHDIVGQLVDVKVVDPAPIK